jgi:hypothetical protein
MTDLDARDENLAEMVDCIGAWVRAHPVETLLLWFPGESGPAPAPVRWKAQPDSLPLGTVLQGSTVEVALACLSDLKPPPPPDWIDRLPAPSPENSENDLIIAETDCHTNA